MRFRRNRRRRTGVPPERWLKWAARFGYAACGSIYLVIGLVAAAVALGLADRTRGAHEVIRLLARQQFGSLVVLALGIGLAGYAALAAVGFIPYGSYQLAKAFYQRLKSTV